MRLSAHLAKIVEAEENRIRRELAGAVVNAFLGDNFEVTISHDADNETERSVTTIAEALRYLFDSVQAENSAGVAWIFAHQPEHANWGKLGPELWVRLSTGNVQDIISDYSQEADDLIEPINDLAKNYD